ncbi:hypothetical protein EVAR_57231_1 [Eumeta japonica]|uniref:Reverse transcriptase domain-containing protein n=1 Tax=Eumeta variegata TaxID=151549 RepID=A0A4C1ZJC1_EUMVA|nr:hypothetical protein EVAR_57231_1 [Eumeta japonica]
MNELTTKCLLYTEDHVILAPPAYGLQEMVNKMNNSVKKKRSMKVNVGKSKVMVLERGENTSECDIFIEGKTTPQVFFLFPLPEHFPCRETYAGHYACHTKAPASDTSRFVPGASSIYYSPTPRSFLIIQCLYLISFRLAVRSR